MKKHLPVLKNCVLFQNISQEDMTLLLNCLKGKLLEIEKGEPVFLEGDSASFVGIVLSGAVQILRDDFYGNRSILSVSEVGDMFGEVFSCAGVSHMPVSAYAVSKSTVLLLDIDHVLRVCSNACRFHNLLISNLLRIVAKNNLRLNQKIRIMSEKTTRDKLIAYLEDQAKKNDSPEFTIPLDRQGLADYLGVERSAMSAAIGKLRADGILETKGSWFYLKESKTAP